MAQTEKKKRKAREFKKLLSQVEVGLGEQRLTRIEIPPNKKVEHIFEK